MSERFTLTAQQSEATGARGGALLIAAGAGSGKTRVLVERFLARVFDDENPCNADEFLIITFTRAAADELRERILTAVTERAADDPGNRRIRRQAVLVRRAEIGTIHSFCSSVIREYAHLLDDIAPDFRIADDSEMAVLKESVAAQVLETWYETPPPGFAQLADAYSPRGDRRLTELLIASYEKLMSHRDPDGWMARNAASSQLEDGTGIAQTVWGEYIAAQAEDAVRFARATAISAIDEINAAGHSPKYVDCFSTAIAKADEFLAAERGDWDTAALAARFNPPRLPTVRGGAPDSVKNAWNRVKSCMSAAAELFDGTQDEQRADMLATAPAQNALFALTRAFRTAFREEKRRRNALDYTDLEHCAAELLTGADGTPTDLAREVSRRFSEVMVDEYQDVSALQDLLLQAVSNSSQKLVMVGDARQSIYRFRLAEPALFIGKYDAFGRGEGGRRVILSANFRSRASILDAVNHVFARIMSRPAGEMEYTEREFLTPGRETENDPPVGLEIVDLSGADDGERMSGKESESVLVARRIREMITGGFEIADGGVSRPVRYGDIVILLRSLKSSANEFREALISQGIPVVLPEPDAFFERKEVETAMAFLSVIDNPRQDIPLVAALTSQVYGFTPDDLAAVRSCQRTGDFYDALCLRAETDARAAAFLRDLAAYRAAAPEMSADDMLWRLYDTTGLVAIVSSWENGTARRASLMRLVSLARDFESTGYRGVYGFVRFAEKLSKRGYTTKDEATGDGVRIMSIHKSKGLEFPVVFLPYLGKRLNRDESSDPVLLHPELGAGLMRVDFDRRIKYPTLSRRAIEHKLQRESLSEELRLLYVAMTRAREKLVMTCSLPNAAKRLESLLPDATEPVPPYALLSRQDVASCLLLAALSRPEALRLLRGEETAPYPGMWDMRITSVSELSPARRVPPPDAVAVETAIAPPPGELAYPYRHATELPSKVTVTELRGRFRDGEAAEDAHAMRERAFVHGRPRFIDETAPKTGAQRGTAIHNALQLLDYSQCATLAGVRGELARLAEAGLLSADEFNAVDAQKIAAFFSGEFGRAAIRADAAGETYREFKFSLLRDAPELFPGVEGGEILLQGVTDLAYLDSGGLTIVDFKSDRVSNEAEMRGKARQYEYQIREYALAMRRVTGLPVLRGVIFFLETGRHFEVML